MKFLRIAGAVLGTILVVLGIAFLYFSYPKVTQASQVTDTISIPHGWQLVAVSQGDYSLDFPEGSEGCNVSVPSYNEGTISIKGISPKGCTVIMKFSNMGAYSLVPPWWIFQVCAAPIAMAAGILFLTLTIPLLRKPKNAQP